MTWQLPGWIRRILKGKSPALSTFNQIVSSDVPIRNASEDLLGRDTFARRITDILAAGRLDEGRMVAIRGNWGDGKSSLKNLVLEQVAKAAPNVVTLEFNPWQWGDSDAIARALFGQIAGRLGRKAWTLERRRRARAFHRYGRALTTASSGLNSASSPSGVATWFASLGLVAAGAGFVVEWLPIRIIAATLLVLAGLFGIFGKLLVQLGRDRASDPVDVLRDDVEVQLRTLKQPIIIVVDDIDRLEHDQIRTLFRQLKANAALPNVILVLLYQPDIVEQALDAITGGHGRDYLEKIIQANFDLPPIANDRLITILTNELDRIVGSHANANSGFDERRWGNLLMGSIKPFIDNLRDVRRYCSSVAIHLPMHEGGRILEVNLIDFLGLEALRVFEPQVYNALAARRSALLSFDSREAPQRAIVEEIVEAASLGGKEAVGRTIRELFPTAAWALGGSHYGDEWLGGWMAERRLCTDRYFDRYFALRSSDSTISDSEFLAILENSGDRNALSASITSLEARNLLDAFLAHLDDARGQLPLDNLPVLLPVIFDIGQKFSRAAGFSSPFVSAWRAASWYLRQELDVARRGEMFLAAMEEGSPLAVPAVLISLDADARDKPEPDSRRLFDDNVLARAKQRWVERITELATNPAALLGLTDIASLLYRWRDFGGIAAPRLWVDQVAENPALLPSLVEEFVTTGSARTIGEFTSRKTEAFQRGHIETFFDLSRLKAQIVALDRKELTPDQERLTEMLDASLSQWLAMPNKEGES